MASSASSSASSSRVHVLYVDHQGHPAPLSSCYHATGSRRLSSSVDRYPPSTLTEIDSAYCPQCLSSHDADSAARLGFCSKPSCQRCPLCCQNVLTLDVQDKLCFYKCGLCQWDSRGCQLTQPLQETQDDDSGTVSRVELARALEDLGVALTAKRLEAQRASSQEMQSLTRAWATKLPANPNTAATAKSFSQTRDGPEGWSVESLEASLTLKKKQFNEPVVPADAPAVTKVALEQEPQPVDPSILQVPPVSLELQFLNTLGVSPTYPRSPHCRDDLLPLPMPFRARLSRRCRAELEEGRPGILLKPKLNPLEGDSSLRSGHGQWWKKDSSAIHVMPRIRVLKHQVKDTCRVFLLEITNPTLGLVRLRFAPSSYQGEKDWDNLDQRISILNDLLVDELFEKHLNLDLQTSITHNMKRTESVELLSSEDSFIELGGKSREIPPNVQNWQPPELTEGEVNNESNMRLVASSASTAYFELTLAADAARPANDPSHSIGVPLSLEIEVGNGSWESSLIEKTTEDSEPDWVPFDLVITWT